MKQKRAIGMEFIGTMILAVAIVGSGHMAANLLKMVELSY